jgi:PilZ domain-containing protein
LDKPLQNVHKSLSTDVNVLELGCCIDVPIRNQSYAQNVLSDRRQIQRRVINRVAKFQNGLGSLPRDCLVTDLSDRGARLYSEIDMPETFTLSMTGEGEQLRRECRVVWRLGGELGVEFIDRGPR